MDNLINYFRSWEEIPMPSLEIAADEFGQDIDEAKAALRKAGWKEVDGDLVKVPWVSYTFTYHNFRTVPTEEGTDLGNVVSKGSCPGYEFTLHERGFVAKTDGPRSSGDILTMRNRAR